MYTLTSKVVSILIEKYPYLLTSFLPYDAEQRIALNKGKGEYSGFEGNHHFRDKTVKRSSEKASNNSVVCNTAKSNLSNPNMMAPMHRAEVREKDVNEMRKMEISYTS